MLEVKLSCKEEDHWWTRFLCFKWCISLTKEKFLTRVVDQKKTCKNLESEDVASWWLAEERRYGTAMPVHSLLLFHIPSDAQNFAKSLHLPLRSQTSPQSSWNQQQRLKGLKMLVLIPKTKPNRSWWTSGQRNFSRVQKQARIELSSCFNKKNRHSAASSASSSSPQKLSWLSFPHIVEEN